MSFIKNNSSTKFFTLKFLRETGPATTSDNQEDILNKMFSYVVLAINEEDAVKKFLLQDIDYSSLALEINEKMYYFDGKIPAQVSKLYAIINKNDIYDLDPENNDDDVKIYQNFIRTHLELIMDVLFILKDKSIMFKIEETNIII